METFMALKPSKKPSKREKPVIGKLSFTDEDVKNSPFFQKQIEEAKRFMKEHPFPIELLRSK
ncbi:hypothetical protein [Chitinophaga sp.]|uniref:hypothetical protein n=1 Tax=Chitinophaga sp. TaxID=1869181 RepID=UPI0031D28805